MKAFFILLGANIRSHRGSLIGIAVLAFLATLMLLCSVNVKENASKEFEELMHAVDAKDILAMINPSSTEEQSRETRAGIEEADGIESVRVWDVVWSSDYLVDGKENSKQFMWRADANCDDSADKSASDGDREVSHYRVFSDDLATLQENPERLEPGQVYLPISSINSLGVQLGSRIGFDLGDEILEFEVVGFIEEPWRGTVSTNPNMGFMCESDYNRVKQAAVEQNAGVRGIAISESEAGTESGAAEYAGAGTSGAEVSDSATSDDESSISTLTHSTFLEVGCTGSDLEGKKAVKNALERNSKLSEHVYIYLASWEMEEYTTLYEQIIGAVLLAFALVVLIVSLVFVGHAVNANVEASYKTYGILKAQGVTGRMMRALLSVQYALGAFAGSCFGVLAALLLVPRVSALFAPFSGLAARSEINAASAVLAVIGLTAIVLLFAALKSRHVERISPLRALRDNAPDAYFGSILTRTIQGRRLAIELALRAVGSKPLQYIGSAFMVCAISVFALLVVGLLNWANSDRFYEALGFPAINAMVTYTDANDIDEAEELIDEAATIVARHRYGNQYALVDDVQTSLFIADDAATFTSVLEGRAPRYDNEVLFTQLDEESFGKTIGDTVTIEAKGNVREYLIVGIFQTTMDLGKSVGILRSGALPLFYGEEEAEAKDTAEGSYVYKLADMTRYEELKSLCEERFEGRVTLARGSEVLTPTPEQISSMMLALIALIGVVSLAIELAVSLMISGRTFLNEKRTLGIYRALGFSSTELRIQFTLRLFFVAIIGAVLGVVVTLVFGDSIMGLLFSSLGISTFDLPMEMFQTAIVCLFVVATFSLFGWIASRRIRSIGAKDLMDD